MAKITEIIYWIFLVIMVLMLIGEFTIFKPTMSFEQENQYLCDCEEIEVKEGGVSGWYMAILIAISIYIIVYGVISLLELQRKRLEGNK